MNPCDGAGAGCLEVFCEAAAASEPGKSALNDPTSGDDHDASSAMMQTEDSRAGRCGVSCGHGLSNRLYSPAR